MSYCFVTYMTLWGSACIIALVLISRLRKTLELFHEAYWLGLFQGWKVISFLVAATGLVTIAPYTGDPTWDYVDATFMSVLTFATAPWVVGTLYLGFRRRRPYVHAYIAVCVWMFSASWSYDLYLVARDGAYPMTWAVNLFASSILYLTAGLLWSLESTRDKGVVLGFMEPGWPSIARTGSLSRIAWYALPFMILGFAMIIPFLL